MSVDKGYISLHRSLLDWEWYTDANTARLFIHLLLTVNHTSKQWHGITVERGQRVASYAKLAAETGMTVKEVRTALNHLKRTGEVAHKATSKFGLFTVKNYNKYQATGTQSDSLRAHSGQSVGSQWAVSGQSKGNNQIMRIMRIMKIMKKVRIRALLAKHPRRTSRPKHALSFLLLWKRSGPIVWSAETA